MQHGTQIEAHRLLKEASLHAEATGLPENGLGDSLEPAEVVQNVSKPRVAEGVRGGLGEGPDEGPAVSSSKTEKGCYWVLELERSCVSL